MSELKGCVGGVSPDSQPCKMPSYYERLHQQLEYYEKKALDIKTLIAIIDNDEKFNEVIEQIEKVSLYI